MSLQVQCGGLANFSADRTKMLLNKNGEIYLSNVDGTDLINLTNTPDIWETDPAFSTDNSKIVYSYRMEDNTHAFLEVKDIATNINEIVFDYKIRNNYQSISFNTPSFIGEDKVMYKFHLTDQTQNPALYRRELHQVDIYNGDLTIFDDYENVYRFIYSTYTNIALLIIDNETILVNIDNLEQIHSFENTALHTPIIFSLDGNFVSVGYAIYDIKLDVRYYVDTFDNSINQSNTKLIGIANRYYD